MILCFRYLLIKTFRWLHIIFLKPYFICINFAVVTNLAIHIIKICNSSIKNMRNFNKNAVNCSTNQTIGSHLNMLKMLLVLIRIMLIHSSTKTTGCSSCRWIYSAIILKKISLTLLQYY